MKRIDLIFRNANHKRKTHHTHTAIDIYLSKKLKKIFFFEILVRWYNTEIKILTKKISEIYKNEQQKKIY